MSTSLGAVLAEKTRFSGLLTGRDLTVLGSFEGDIELSGTLRLGPEAAMTGSVCAREVEVAGQFQGEIKAERLVFAATAVAAGRFLAPRLGIADGAQVQGGLNVERATPAAQSPQPADAVAAAVPAATEDEGDEGEHDTAATAGTGTPALAAAAEASPALSV